MAHPFAPTALFALIAAVAGLTQTVAGFGFMLVALTFGALLFPVAELVPVALPLSLLSSIWVSFDQRRLIDRPLLLRVILPAMVCGAAVGFVLSDHAPAAALKRALGMLVLGFVGLRLWQGLRARRATQHHDGEAANAPRPWPPWLRSGVIFAAGVVQGLFGTGGPLLVLALQGSRLPAGPFRATLMAVWVCLNSTLVTALALDGRYDSALLLRFAVAAPAVAAGVWLGQWVAARLSAGRFQVAVHGMLTCAALALLV